MSETKYGKAKAYNKAFWDALRKKIRAMLEEMTIPQLGILLGTNPDAYRKFAHGHAKSLTEVSLSVLRQKGVLTAEIEYLGTVEIKPLDNWQGELKTVQQVAKEKGFCDATIRRWCKAGKLNFIKIGRRYAIAVDEKYASVRQSERGKLMAEIVALRAEVARLRQQVETQQLEFSFVAPSGPDSDHDLLAVNLERIQ